MATKEVLTSTYRNPTYEQNITKVKDAGAYEIPISIHVECDDKLNSIASKRGLIVHDYNSTGDIATSGNIAYGTVDSDVATTSNISYSSNVPQVPVRILEVSTHSETDDAFDYEIPIASMQIYQWCQLTL